MEFLGTRPDVNVSIVDQDNKTIMDHALDMDLDDDNKYVFYVKINWWCFQGARVTETSCG